MKPLYKNESQWSVIARELLELIIYDNDLMPTKESFRKYKRRVQRECQKVFSLYPQLVNEEWLEDFAIGDRGNMEEEIKKYPELTKLDAILNDFFDNYQDKLDEPC